MWAKTTPMFFLFFLFVGMGTMSYQPGTFGQPPNYYGSGRLEEEFSGQPLAMFRIRIRIGSGFNWVSGSGFGSW